MAGFLSSSIFSFDVKCFRPRLFIDAKISLEFSSAMTSLVEISLLALSCSVHMIRCVLHYTDGGRSDVSFDRQVGHDLGYLELGGRCYFVPPLLESDEKGLLEPRLDELFRAENL